MTYLRQAVFVLYIILYSKNSDRNSAHIDPSYTHTHTQEAINGFFFSWTFFFITKLYLMCMCLRRDPRFFLLGFFLGQ